MKFIKRSTKWILPFDVGFAILAWLSGVLVGVMVFHTQPVRTRSVESTRALISNHATAAEVVANLDTQNIAGKGEYISGFQCAAWTNGDKTTGHGWVVEYCAK